MNNPTLYGQLPGDAGIYQTVTIMRDMVNRSFLHPYIRERAANVVRGCQRRPSCEDYALSAFVKSKVQYLRDPIEVEALHEPVSFYEARLRQGKQVFGDCDDMSIYLASLLKSIGHQPFFRILARTGNEFHHVHVLCHGNSLDPTMELGKYPFEASRAIQVKI
jgi:hypothetical protein